MDKPDPHIHRFLISTTSRFTGVYESEVIRIDHAWPAAGSRYQLRVGLEANPHSRNYFVVSLVIEPPEKKTIVVPDYTGVGEQICAAASILYGKRFDNHGLCLTKQMFFVPDLGEIQPIEFCTAPLYNHQPRKDLGIPLKLDRFDSVAQLFTNPALDQNFKSIFFAAARFYLRSVQMFDVEPEFAYLDLVTCGEILANFYNYTHDELYDEETKRIFETIRAGIEDGDNIVLRLQGRMFQVKRRYILTLTRLLNDAFFTVSECTGPFGQLKKDEIQKRLKSAYDLRSQYVHTGIEFGHWTLPLGDTMNEVIYGKPIAAPREFEKALEWAPTFFGLERIMRYCLLRFLHLNGVQIDQALDS